MKEMWRYQFPIGELSIGSDGIGITDITFGYVEGVPSKNPMIEGCARQLNEYFNGTRKRFDIKLSVRGTEFQNKVWDAVSHVPYGETRSYGDIAREIGNHRAARAVGMAVNRNRTMIVIPCQRIVGADGSLVGYAGRLDVKQFLLDLEKKYR